MNAPFVRMAVTHAVRRGLAEAVLRRWSRVHDPADMDDALGLVQGVPPAPPLGLPAPVPVAPQPGGPLPLAAIQAPPGVLPHAAVALGLFGGQGM